MKNMNTSTIFRYRFVLHTRRLTTIAVVSALVLLVAGLLALLSTFHALSGSQDLLAVLSYLIAFLALAFLLPMLIFSIVMRVLASGSKPTGCACGFQGRMSRKWHGRKLALL